MTVLLVQLNKQVDASSVCQWACASCCTAGRFMVSLSSHQYLLADHALVNRYEKLSHWTDSNRLRIWCHASDVTICCLWNCKINPPLHSKWGDWWVYKWTLTDVWNLSPIHANLTPSLTRELEELKALKRINLCLIDVRARLHHLQFTVWINCFHYFKRKEGKTNFIHQYCLFNCPELLIESTWLTAFILFMIEVDYQLTLFGCSEDALLLHCTEKLLYLRWSVKNYFEELKIHLSSFFYKMAGSLDI